MKIYSHLDNNFPCSLFMHTDRIATNDLGRTPLMTKPMIYYPFFFIFRGAKNVECGGGGVSINEFAPVVLEEILSQEKDDGQEELASEKDVVRRINEELAEFRQQLKQSQELFHALVNNSI